MDLQQTTNENTRAINQRTISRDTTDIKGRRKINEATKVAELSLSVLIQQPGVRVKPPCLSYPSFVSAYTPMMGDVLPDKDFWRLNTFIPYFDHKRIDGELHMSEMKLFEKLWKVELYFDFGADYMKWVKDCLCESEGLWNLYVLVKIHQATFYLLSALSHSEVMLVGLALASDLKSCWSLRNVQLHFTVSDPVKNLCWKLPVTQEQFWKDFVILNPAKVLSTNADLSWMRRKLKQTFVYY